MTELRLSADDVTKSSNGTCTVRIQSVIFNLYRKTKTLLVQGKAVDCSQDLLPQPTIQALNDQNSAKSIIRRNKQHSPRHRTYNGGSTSTDRTAKTYPDLHGIS